jgi:hypothetical protein
MQTGFRGRAGRVAVATIDDFVIDGFVRLEPRRHLDLSRPRPLSRNGYCKRQLAGESVEGRRPLIERPPLASQAPMLEAATAVIDFADTTADRDTIDGLP